jgi:hypothetical protein
MSKRREEMERQREARRLEEIREKMDDERGVLKGGVSSTGLDRDDESEDESSSGDDEESEDESSSSDDDEEEESKDEGDNEADVKEEL